VKDQQDRLAAEERQRRIDAEREEKKERDLEMCQRIVDEMTRRKSDIYSLYSEIKSEKLRRDHLDSMIAAGANIPYNVLGAMNKIAWRRGSMPGSSGRSCCAW
jgi:hypothetical protein